MPFEKFSIRDLRIEKFSNQDLRIENFSIAVIQSKRIQSSDFFPTRRNTTHAPLGLVSAALWEFLHRHVKDTGDGEGCQKKCAECQQ